MPLRGYFLSVGSALIALLFVADWYLPSRRDEPSRSHVDRYTIRIHSAHTWPSAVVFDTTQPTIVPPPVVAAVEAPEPKPAHEAYAKADEPSVLPAAKPADDVKPVKQRVHRAKTASAANNRLAANNDMFGFGNDWFAPRRREASASGHESLRAKGFWTRSW